MKSLVCNVFLLGLVFALSSARADLTHRYSFASVASDSIGGANGTLVGSATISNNSVVLPGTGSYVDLPDGIVSGYNSITFELWVTDTGSGGWARIFDFGSDTSHYLFLTLPSGSGNLRGAYNNGAGEQIIEWPANRPPAGQKTHIVLTSDSASLAGRLYVNGVQVGLNSSVTITPAALGTTINNWLGRSQFGGDPYFLGTIDEFRIYDSALSPAEVFANYQGGPDVIPVGPVYFANQPQNQSVTEQQSLTFSANVGGTPPLSLQWYRNGALLAGATNLSFTFAASVTDSNSVYRLWATNVFNGTNYVAASSNATLFVLADSTPPVILRAQGASTNGVNLFFSEPILAATATDTLNYTLTGPAGAITVDNAALDATGTIVTLGTAPMLSGSNYTVTVSGLRDRSSVSNSIAPGGQATFMATIYTLVDIGSPAASGTFLAYTNGGLTLAAGGTGVGGSADELSFAYQTFNGDFDLQMRLGSLAFSDAWTTAGLMARDGLATNVLFAAALATPGPEGSFFTARTNVGSAATAVGFFPVNYPDTWLRLQRAGNFFNGYASLDGCTWTSLGSVTIAASSTLQVGVAISSHNPAQVAAAFFDSTGSTANTSLNTQPLPFEPPGPSTRRTGLIFSEIMYHPAGSSSLEFVEIYNSDLVFEDLSGYRLDGSIDFTFPPGTIIPAGGFLVVARNPAALQSAYGIIGVLGPYANNLPNSSGTIRLRNELGSVLLEVDYDTLAPWPVAPDGSGHSLVLRRPSYGENDPRAWAASDVVGGSPGRADAYGYEPLRGVVINEFLAHTDLPDLDAIELFNNSTQPLNLAGCILTDDPSTNKFVIGNVTIPARGYVFFDETQMGFRLDAAGETIFLENPAGTRVLDAARYEAQENGVSFGRFPNGSDQWYRLSTKTFGSANLAPRFSEVGINEIMYHPISGLDDDQYVELYNRGTNAVNLSGWSFTTGIAFTFPTNAMIPAGGFIVVAKNSARLLTSYPNLNASNTVGNFGGHLSHSGERIALAMPDTIVSTNRSGIAITNLIAIVVDEVTYHDGGRWGQWADGGGSSLELIDPRSDRRLAANWADSDETTKAPWTLIERTDAATLGMGDGTTGNGVPNRFEFFLQGAGECLVDDVEVHSNGGVNQVANAGFESGATGWAFQGTHAHASIETVLAPFSGSQSLHVRATGRGDTGANRVRTAIATMPVNGMNQATLRARVRWLRGDPNILLRLRGNWLECAGVMTVPSNLGTPGAPNSRLVADAGPAIYNVSHFPVLPAANAPVVVSARAHDSDGVGSITLFYRIDPATTYSSVTMLDGGTGGDAFAGDRIFSATIPGQAADTVVAFYVQAQDGRFPPVITRFPSDAPARECLVHFGESLRPGGMGNYRLWLTQSNLTYWAAREKNSNEGLDATFVYGNSRVVYNAQALYSGSPWHTPSYNGPLGSFACNYDVDMPPDDLLLGADSFNLEGQSVIQGNTFSNDDTAQAETTAHWMARQLGVQPDYRRYVFVYLNGQQRGMVYYDYQQPDGDVVTEYFPDDADGHLHKIEDWFEFDDAGSGQNIITAKLLNNTVNGKKRTERYRWNFRPRATETPNDFADLYALVDAVNAPGPEPFTSATLKLADVSEWMRMFAVEHMSGDWDSYGYRRGKNMFAYKPQQGPWRLLLWDIQLVFGKSGDGTSQNIFDLGDVNDPTQGDPIIGRMYNHPPFVREFWSAMEELVNGPMLPANYNPLMDARYAALVSQGAPVQDPISVKSWIDARRNFILPQIPQSAFTVNGPTSFSSSSNSITLSGTAPIAAGTILVNGASYPLTWTSVTNWTVRVSVTANSNPLTIEAVDRNGNVIGTNTVTVTYTGATIAPEGNVIFNEILSAPSLPGAGFIELFNTHSNYTFDLSNWRVTGSDYTFPPGSILPPRSFLVLAENPYAFAIASGATNPVFGAFSSPIDPAGETLSLLRPGSGTNEIVVDRVRYENAAPWPSSATNGNSFQLVDSAQDNSRVANWRVMPPSTNVTIPIQQWIYVTNTGVLPAVAPRFYFYLESAGDIYIDDAKLVTGTVPESGANLLINGDFESTLSSAWTLTPDFATSALSTSIKRAGNSSLHLIATAPGSGQNDAVFQTISPQLAAGGTYTLSFWYLQNTNGNPFTSRLSGSGAGNGVAMTFNPLVALPSTNVTLGATPGQPNSVQSNLTEFPPIWLNEIQADNVTGPADNFSQHDPWIELYNGGTNSFNLAGYYLTDTYSNLTKFVFPTNAVIPSNGFLVVWCDNQTSQTASNMVHTSFRLTAGAGNVALARSTNGETQVLDYLNYTNLPSNWSYGDVPDGQPFFRAQMFSPTAGATNNGALPPITIFINEWMADNLHTLADAVDGNFEDWFELYNPGNSDADLGGYYLTDNLANKAQYLIPNNGHYVVPAHGFLLVWADNEPNQNSTNAADLHASFALSKGGEAIGLFASDGTTVDAIAFGAQTTDVSQGRFPDGSANIVSMPTPTPRARNIGSNTPPSLNALSDCFVHIGQTVHFTALASDNETPWQTLTFSLSNSPAGAAINPVSGVFDWAVTNVVVPGTNSVIIRVTDNGVPPLADARTFSIFVQPLPQIGGVSMPGDGSVHFSFGSLAGVNYQVEFKDHLTDPGWSPLGGVIAGTGSAINLSDVMTAPARFYRIVVLP